MLPDRLQRAGQSLLGLSLGDALGSQFFVPANRPHLSSRSLPSAPWQWTDDTEMACSVYLALAAHHAIDQDFLAASFARRHDFDRGYGPATGRMLRLVREGGDWRSLAARLFDGSGSWGNGAAMRVAPVGAFFADDPAEAVRQAALSATVTHAHPEAIAGAMAVAAAASGRPHRWEAMSTPPAPSSAASSPLAQEPAASQQHGCELPNRSPSGSTRLKRQSRSSPAAFPRPKRPETPHSPVVQAGPAWRPQIQSLLPPEPRTASQRAYSPTCQSARHHFLEED